MKSFTPLEGYKELRKFKVQSRNLAASLLYPSIPHRRGGLLTGFTLVEVILYSLLITIILAVIADFTVSFYRHNRYFINQKQAIIEARQSFITITNNIREAAFSQTGAYPIREAGNNRLRFFNDADSDGIIEEVRIELNNTTLTEEIREPDDTVSQNITRSAAIRNIAQNEPLFRYYDSSNQLVTNLNILTDIRVVEISLIVNIDPAAPPNEALMKTWITPRNLE